MQRRPKLEGPELLAALAGGFLSSYDAFAGLIGMNFAGAGATGFRGVLSVTLGFELPVYVIFLFVSRRALTYACWSMYAVIHIEDWVLALTEKVFPVDAIGILEAFFVTILFSGGGLVSLAVALLATYLYREERETLARNSAL